MTLFKARLLVGGFFSIGLALSLAALLALHLYAPILQADDQSRMQDLMGPVATSSPDLNGNRPPTDEDGKHCREHGPCPSMPMSETPEPGTVGLVVAGILVCVIKRRKRLGRAK